MRLAFLAAAFAAAASAQESKYLTNLRQLTDGGQNAESYWSPDGKRLVFQSTRGDLKCDQIFIMNADGSGQRMVSTGKGRTTCGYFLNDGKRIVYGSTHESDPACPPPVDRSKGYVWAVYPGYDIFLADDTGRIINRLTSAPGYDAEATVNFKTNRIIYTSMASGDLDLWTMSATGANKRQLTRTEGYDGGAVFSRDGKKIVWRANHPAAGPAMDRYRDLLKENLTTPMKMEIFIADAGGRNVKQLTNFNCASFAPTFTPDGKKILFSSNKHECDGRKFELFLMNLDGSGLEQVTSFGGFTSFPEFSPDGKKLAFSSDYKAKSRYEFNIFVADWK
jgi:Tol biopolymer transport system component